MHPQLVTPTRRKQLRPKGGVSLGNWQLVSLAARGSLADLYRARPVSQAQGQADYVVKVLHPKWEDHPPAIETLRREAMVGRHLSHPHLVPILEACIDVRPYFVVMPWLAGVSLRDLIRRGPTPDLPLALWFLRQTTEALAALHRNHWLHGDIKSSNIQVSPEAHVTLIDLGFARRLDEEGVVVDRPLSGTGAYLAPEAIISRLRADVRSDLYSLGVVLFELLTGRLPYDGRTLAEVTSQHRRMAAPKVRTLVPHLPSSVEKLVQSMLAKDPLRRPQSADELLSRLVALEIETFSQRAE